MAARKTTARPTPVARRDSAQKAPAKAVAGKKPAARKAAAKKVAAKTSAGNKTTATTASVDRYLAAIKDAARRRDCEALCALMAKATRRARVSAGTPI